MLVGASGFDSVDTGHKRHASQQTSLQQPACERARVRARTAAFDAKWRSVRRASAVQAIATLNGIEGALGCNCRAGPATTSDAGPFKLALFALLSSEPFLSPCFLLEARAQERAMGTPQGAADAGKEHIREFLRLGERRGGERK